MALARPAVEGTIPFFGDGAIVSSIDAGGAIGKTKRVQPGDVLLAIDGVKIRDFKHAVETLRSASGVIRLVIAASSGLPDGWAAHTDKKGVQYYTCAARQLIS